MRERSPLTPGPNWSQSSLRKQLFTQKHLSRKQVVVKTFKSFISAFRQSDQIKGFQISLHKHRDFKRNKSWFALYKKWYFKWKHLLRFHGEVEWYISPLRNFIIQWFKNKVWSFFFFSWQTSETVWTESRRCTNRLLWTLPPPLKNTPVFCTRWSSWAVWIVSTPERRRSNVKTKKGKAALFDSALRFQLQVDLLKQKKTWLSFHFESLYMGKSHYRTTKKPLFEFSLGLLCLSPPLSGLELCLPTSLRKLSLLTRSAGLNLAHQTCSYTPAPL